MILGSPLGNFGRTKSSWQSYRSGLSTKKRNILDLKVGLFWLSAQTGKGGFNPQRVTSQYDLDADFSVELAQAVVELADAVLKKVGVTDRVPGLNTLLSIASNRLVVAGIYAARKSTINGYIQNLADSTARYTNRVLDFLDDVRDRTGDKIGKVSLSDLRAIFRYIIKGGSVPPVPSLGEREAPTEPTTPFRVQVMRLIPSAITPTGFPSGAFTVHDPSINKWRVLVRA